MADMGLQASHTIEVSMIVPVYNVVNRLDQCMKSVVSQSFGNFKVILVDDGSTDGSSKLCDRWAEKDSRIRVIHKENEGVSIARNKGCHGFLVNEIEKVREIQEKYFRNY